MSNPTHATQLHGCTGNCQQGRAPCDCRDELANGWTRTTQPGDLLPTSMDPATGVSAEKAAVIAIALVAACLVLVLLVHAAVSTGVGR